MKVVILCGGLGTRMREETEFRPKPMVKLGSRPILWHIMKIYAHYGFKDFVLCLGYKGEVIKEYFLNFYALNNDVTLDLATGETLVHHGRQPHWKVHLVDTGAATQTGGRVKRLERWLGADQTFMMTYGDGVANIDICALRRFHEAHGKTSYGLNLDGAAQDPTERLIQFAHLKERGRHLAVALCHVRCRDDPGDFLAFVSDEHELALLQRG